MSAGCVFRVRSYVQRLCAKGVNGIDERFLSDGRYRLIRVIGRGASAVVYLAEDTRVGKTWAVKEIAGDPARVRREAEVLMRLEHPALPRIVDLLTEGEKSYLVMDYVEGSSLGRLLRSGRRFSVGEILTVALCLCDVLQYLHGQSPPVIYRDLKPDNVLLTSGGQIRLVDFGIAGEDGGESGDADIRRGTRGYAAPEQYRGEADARSDLYALGATLRALAVPSGRAAARMFGPVIRRCMRRNPRRRFRSAAEVKRRLAAREKKRRHRGLRLAAPFAAAAIFAFCLTGVWLEAEMLRYERCLRGLADCTLAAEPAEQRERAEDFYREALRLNPCREDAYLAWLEYGAAAGEVGEAIARVRRDQAESAGFGAEAFPACAYRIGLLYFCGMAQGETPGVDYRKALAAWSAAGDSDGADGELLYYEKILAKALLSAGKEETGTVQEALSGLEAVLGTPREREDSGCARCDLACAAAAIALAGTGDASVDVRTALWFLAEAERMTEEEGTIVSARRPGVLLQLGEAWFLSGLSAENRGEREEAFSRAEAWCEKAAEADRTDPGRERALLALCTVELESGNYEQARECLKRAEALAGAGGEERCRELEAQLEKLEEEDGGKDSEDERKDK